MKKLIASILAVTLTFGAVALPMTEGGITFGGSSVITASAEEFVSGDYDYEVLDDGTVEITYYHGDGGEVTIPSTIAGKKVTSIGDWAFSECSELTSITIPNSVTSIGEGAFSGCSSLTSITIPNGVTSIGYWAFDGCSSLTSITIPNSVTSIGYGAFNGCTSLTSVTIPNSVTSIGESAFGNCSSLKSVTIPVSVTNIEHFAFSNCSGLTSITVNSNNKNYSSKDGVLFNKNKTELIQYPGGNTRKTYTIPNSVTSIGNLAFGKCSVLTGVTIPNSVKSIGGAAFANSTALTSITVPSSVTNLGDTAFYGCSGITSITIQGSVKYIGNYTFENCSKLKKITIPSSVITIGDYAFYSCSSLKDVYYTGTKDQWNKILLHDFNDNLKNASIHYNSTFTKPINISKTKVTGLTTKTYTGKQIKPTIKVTYGKTVLKNGTDYTVKYGTNKIGKGTVTITGKGKYTGSVTKTFTINPRKTPVTVKSTAKGKFTATVAKKTEATKYQIQYCSNSKFKGAKKVTTKATKTVIKGTSKKTYYVRVRTIKTIGKTNYVSGWSAVKKVKVK